MPASVRPAANPAAGTAPAERLRRRGRRARPSRGATGQRPARWRLARVHSRPRPDRESRTGDPDRDRRGSRPGWPAQDAGAGRSGLRRALRRPAGRRREGAHHDVRGRAPGAGAGARHRGDVELRASPAALPRRRPRRLHPGPGWPDHRSVQTGPTGRGLRSPTTGPGAADLADRGHADGQAAAARGDRGDRLRAHVHGGAGDPEAGRSNRHVGGARPAAAGRAYPLPRR